MDKAIYEFKIYLEELYETNKLKLQVKKIPNRKKIEIQQMDIEKLLNDIILFEKGYSTSFDFLIFNDFRLLSSYLCSSNFSTMDCLSIISLAIKFNVRPLAKNLKIYESSTKLTDHYRNREEYKKKRAALKKNNKREQRQLYKLTINEVFYKCIVEPTKTSAHIIRKGIFHRDKQLYNPQRVVELCVIFYNGIITNKYYNDENIDIAIDSLKQLFVDDNFISNIYDYLKNNKIEKPVEVKDNRKEAIEETRRYSEAELTCDQEKVRKNEFNKYRETLKQVLEYYDPETKEFVNTIPYEKIIDIAALLLDLGYNENDIHIFLKKSKGNLLDGTPIRDFSNLDLQDIYRLLNNKFNYYGDKIDGLEEHILIYMDYYKELAKCYSEEDYEVLYQIWLEEIETISNILGAKYDYEIETAKAIRKELQN